MRGVRGILVVVAAGCVHEPPDALTLVQGPDVVAGEPRLERAVYFEQRTTLADAEDVTVPLGEHARASCGVSRRRLHVQVAAPAERWPLPDGLEAPCTVGEHTIVVRVAAGEVTTVEPTR